MLLTNGNALAARLFRSAKDLGVPVWLDSPVKALRRDADGNVTGADVLTPQGLRRVIAKRGVVLACGGFPQDVGRRQTLYKHPSAEGEHVSSASPGNTGDGLRLAEKIGAQTQMDYPNAGAWAPTSLVPRADGTKGPFPHFIDRGKPGVMAVTRSGKRFVNEANSYHDFVQGMERATEARPAGRGLPDLRSPHDPEVRPRSREARAPSLGAFDPLGLSDRRQHPRRTGQERRHRCRRFRSHDCALQPGRGNGRGHGVRTRQHRLQPLPRRSGRQAEPVPRSGGQGPVLRRARGAGQHWHLRRPAHRRAARASSATMARRSPVSTPSATTWRASWAATTRAVASLSGRA